MTSETMQQELLHIIQRNSPDFLRRLLVNAVCLERAVKGSERGKGMTDQDYRREILFMLDKQPAMLKRYLPLYGYCSS